ncbi:MAG: c-type cytochrome [Caulobacteraceae bacterium]
MQNFSIKTCLAAAVLAATPAAALAQAQTPPQSRGDAPGGGAILNPPVTGEQVYRQVCQACHMADAKGGSGAATIPAISGNPRLASGAYPIVVVVKGRGAMPGFSDLLSPAQIANVVGYIRTHFDNAYPSPVTAANVKQLEGTKPTP